MSVTIPSDLLVDVMRNADPGSASAAVRRLARRGPDLVAASQFGQMVGKLESKSLPGKDRIPSSATASEPGELSGIEARTVSRAEPEFSGGKIKRNDPGSSPYVAFEQMFLRSVLEASMPSADSGLYGDDSSADIWRSMTADQLAGVYARSGGVGIAVGLASRDNTADVAIEKQWPYFETSQIRSFVGPAEGEA
jgi:peptidoglycan hydrolase FlgJ